MRSSDQNIIYQKDELAGVRISCDSLQRIFDILYLACTTHVRCNPRHCSLDIMAKTKSQLAAYRSADLLFIAVIIILAIRPH